MSDYDVPEVASIYGALDSDTIADGRALDAHVIRTVTTNANRLMAKRSHLVTFTWPIRPTSGDYDGFHRWVPSSTDSNGDDQWTCLVPPTKIAYRRGLRTFEVRIRARVYLEMDLQFATRAQPFHRDGTPNVISLTDTADALDDFAETGFMMDPSGEDEIAIYGRATSEGTDLADDAIGGAPNDRSGIGGAISYFPSWLGFSGAGTWVDRGYMYAGTQIAFRDGAEIVRRTITGATANTLWWGPPLDTATGLLVEAGDDWSLYRLPTLGLGTISCVAEERSL